MKIQKIALICAATILCGDVILAASGYGLLVKAEEGRFVVEGGDYIVPAKAPNIPSSFLMRKCTYWNGYRLVHSLLAPPLSSHQTCEWLRGLR